MGTAPGDRSDTELVGAVRAGDQAAYGELFDRWFDRVHDLSRRIVHDDGIAAEVAQDTFLAAWQGLDGLRDDSAFGGWLLRIARNRSLNRLARERRSSTPGDDTVSTVADRASPGEDPFEELDQAGRVSLVWEAAQALGPADLSILDLHLRHGLSGAELADELGVTANNAHQKLFQLRKRLGGAVRAVVLWRGGRPSCASLGVTLEQAGSPRFGPEVVKLVDRHLATCADCDADRAERLSPAALFAAAPVVAAPILLKAGAAEGLAAAGVPMQGSVAAGNAGGAAGAGPSDGQAPSADSGGPKSDAGPSGNQTGQPGTRPGSTDPGPPPPSADATVEAARLQAGLGGPGPDPALTPLPTEAAAAPRTIGDQARRRRVGTAMAVAAALVLAVIAVILSSGVDSDRVETAAPGSVSTTATDAGPTSAGGGTTTEGPPKTMVVVPPSDPTPTAPGETTAESAPTTAGTSPTATTATDPATTEPAPTTTTEPPTPPVVVRVSVIGTKANCDRLPAWEVTWTATDTESVAVGPAGGSTLAGPAQGNLTFCAPYSTTFTVTATGPGGTATGTSKAPDQPVD